MGGQNHGILLIFQKCRYFTYRSPLWNFAFEPLDSIVEAMILRSNIFKFSVH